MEIKTKALRAAIETTVACVDKDSVRFYLEHVLWSMAGDTLTLTGTDGMVISEVATLIPDADEIWSGAIHHRGCQAILEWLKDTTSATVAMHDGHICIGAHDSMLRLFRFGGKVPSFESVWARSPSEEIWRGPTHSLYRMAKDVNGVEVIPLGDALYDPARIKQATKSWNTVVAYGKTATDPVLFTMDNWRALVMPMTIRGARSQEAPNAH